MTFSAYTTNSKSCKTMWESTNLNFNQLGRKTTQTPGSETVAYTHIFWNSMFCELTEAFWTHTVNNQRYSTSSGFSECQTHQNFVRTQYLLDNFCFCFIHEQDFSVQPWLSWILKPKHRKISSKCIMKDKCGGRTLSMKWLVRIFRSAGGLGAEWRSVLRKWLYQEFMGVTWKAEGEGPYFNADKFPEKQKVKGAPFISSPVSSTLKPEYFDS